MSSSEIIKLEYAVSRLRRLSLINLEAVLRLTTALANETNVAQETRDEAFKVVDLLQQQLELLKEMDRVDALDGK